MSSLLTWGLGNPTSPSLIVVLGLSGTGSALLAFKVAGAAQVGPLVVRVTFTSAPLAVDPTAANDALRPSSWSVTGPVTATVLAAAPVTGDPFSIDLYLGAPLVGGIWTATVADTLQAAAGDPIADPRYGTFEVEATPTDGITDPDELAAADRLRSAAGGAVVEGLIRRHFNHALAGPTWDDLIFAVEGDEDNLHGDAYVSDLARRAFLQLFASTASGAYLDRRGAEVGVARPENVGIPDDAYRRLINALSNNLLTDAAVHDVLETFYGPDNVRATLTTTLTEPFALQDGDDLELLFGERRLVRVQFASAAFQRIVQASAVEVAASIDRAIRAAGLRGFAAEVVEADGGEGQVRVYADARGVASGIRVLGGRAQVALRFPTDIFPDDDLSPPYGSWNISSSPTAGRIRFTSVLPTAYDLLQVREGDRVLIYGREFPLALLGTYDVLEVSVTYPLGTLNQWFEVAGAVSGSTTVSQVQPGSIVFLRSTLRSVHDADAPAYAVEVGDGLAAVLPAMSPVVVRGDGSAGYLASAEALDIQAVDRAADGTVRLTFSSAHGLLVDDFVQVDDVVQPVAAPAVTAGSASATLGASHL